LVFYDAVSAAIAKRCRCAMLGTVPSGRSSEVVVKRLRAI
jgi:hypothetical protein